MAIRLEFLEAGTRWMSGLTGRFLSSVRECWNFAAPPSASLLAPPAPCPWIQLRPALLHQHPSKFSPGHQHRVGTSPGGKGRDSGLSGSGEGFGDGSHLELAESSNLNRVISVTGEQNVLKPHIPIKHPVPRPFPLLPASPASCSLSATKEILQQEIRAGTVKPPPVTQETQDISLLLGKTWKLNWKHYMDAALPR